MSTRYSRPSRLSKITIQRDGKGSDLAKALQVPNNEINNIENNLEEERTQEIKNNIPKNMLQNNNLVNNIPTLEEPEEENEEEETESQSETSEDEKEISEINITKKPSMKKIDQLTPRTKRIAIDEELKNLNLIPLEKVVLNDQQQPSVKYIKVITVNGIPILLDLDIEALIAVNSEDFNVEEMQDKFNIPMKEILDINKIGMELEGLAFECIDGICTFTRDENLNPISKTLKLKKNDNTQCLSSSKCLKKLDSDGFEVYPIVKYSDIKTNPKLAIDNVEIQSKKLRNELFTRSNQVIQQTQSSINKLNQSYTTAIKLVPEKAKQLSNTITKLQKFAADYQKQGINEKNMSKYTAVLKNIQERNSLVSELISIISKLANVSSTLKNATIEIDKVVNALNIDFENLDRDLSLS
jgi:ribosomal protein S17E